MTTTRGLPLVREVRLSYGPLQLINWRITMDLKARKRDGVVVLDMAGRLTTGEPALLLRETVRKYIADGNTKFVLNLGEVSYIDSGGLGELITNYTSIRNKSGDVKLLNLTKKAQDLLQMTKLLTVFDSYSDEDKAIAALN
jgi:anti-sigma B factor antagonist